MSEHRPPPISGIDHLTLPVRDLDAAERFYVELLGATRSRLFDRETFLRFRPDRAAEVDSDNSPLHLEVCFGDGPKVQLFLQRRHEQVPPPHPHLALAISPDDVDAFAQRLRAANVPVDGPRRLGPPGHASLYFSDPFGNTLELVCMGYRGAVTEGPPDVTLLGWTA